MEIPTLISTADKIKYDQLFQKADVNRDGVVDGNEGRNFFEHSKLPRENLALIWGLTDLGSKGYLTQIEFRIAMHLVYCFLKGYTLPSVVPPSLFTAAEGGTKEDSNPSRHSRTNSIENQNNLVNNPYNPNAMNNNSSFNIQQNQFSDLKTAILTSNQNQNQELRTMHNNNAPLGRELNPMVLVPMPHLGSMFQKSDQEKAKNISMDLMKQMFVEMEMGNFGEALSSIASVKVVLHPYESVLIEEVKMTQTYETALHLLLEIREVDEDEDEVTGAMLARFLAELETQPKHKIVCMRMAAKKNFSVQNYGIAARFIRSILRAHPVDERSLDSTLVRCQEESFMDHNVPKYECVRCKKVVSAAPLNCSVCNTPIQANYFLDLRKIRKQQRKIEEEHRIRMEEERRRVEEIRRKEDEERRKREEQERIRNEQERRRLEEENRIRMEQEQQRQMEEYRRRVQLEQEMMEKKREEERIRLEEAMRIEMQQKMMEEEQRRRMEEENRRRWEEEEAKRRIQEKAKRDEELKRVLEEARKKEEEERELYKIRMEEWERNKRMEEERERERRRKEEEERERIRREEEERRINEERMRMEEERRRIEEERIREEEERRRQQEENERKNHIPGILPLPPAPPSPLFSSISNLPIDEKREQNLYKNAPTLSVPPPLPPKNSGLNAPPSLYTPPLNSTENQRDDQNFTMNSLAQSLPPSRVEAFLPSHMLHNHLSQSSPSEPPQSNSVRFEEPNNQKPSGPPRPFLGKKANTLDVDELVARRINEQLQFQMKHKLKGSSQNNQIFNQKKSMDSNGKPASAIPIVSKRDEIINETILTERKYVESLRILIEVFYKPLQESGMITASQLRVIFGVVEILYGTNQVLLSKLEERAKHWTSHSKIGDIILEIVPYLKVYTAYVNNANLSIVTVAEISNTYHDFHKFLEDAKNNGGCGLDIQSYLIGPIQRIPRYVLLLKDLYKNTTEDHPDHDDLAKALESIESVAIYVNEKKREAENMTTVMRIQSQVIFDSGTKEEPLVQPHRRLVKKGKLVEKDEVSLRKRSRVCFLFNDIFLVTKPRLMSSFGGGKSKGKEGQSDELDGIFSFVKKLHLSKCGVANILEEKDSAELTDLRKRSFLLYEKFESSKGEGLKDERGSKKRFVFVASSEEEKIEWVKDIQEIIDGLVDQSKRRKDKTSSSLSSDDDLTNEDWALLLTHGKQKTFKKGETILKADTRNHSIYRIVSGTVKCVLGYKKSFSTEYTVPKGGILGFRAFVGDGHATQPREIIADSDNTVVDYVEVSFVLRLFQVEPGVAERFYGMAARSFERRLVGMEALDSKGGKAGSYIEAQDFPTTAQLSDSSQLNNKDSNGEEDVELKKKNQHFKLLFPLLKDEAIVREYYCTYKRSLTYYGRIYITGNYIAFFAKLFGVTKQKSISFESVGKIEKVKTSIDITRAKSDGFKVARFTFDKKSERDEAFVTIDNLWRNHKEAQGKPPVTPVLGSAKTDVGAAFHLLQGDLPTKDDWNSMLKDSQLLTFEEGQTIIQEGTSYMKIFQIISGTCSIIKRGTDGSSNLLSQANRGEIFGEISFLEKGEASASVVAASRVELCVIEEDSIHSLFESTPGLRGRFYKYLAGVTEGRLRNREMQFLRLHGIN
eukprot:TRINITY_DN836_c0_g3_i1.p1 TRINITY_DN836_c0_g3~~TRINITY_DN836_c0_g3_i1.p1  ORF type:complete len:1638 (-),score=764.62 TRINITY_DN836_c0_g3_i1:204-5117(-)